MLSTYFFFKQKTAYKMRISDWSSDVCASDLWAGIGYHFVVQLDGSIEAGRPEGAVGSHVAGYNGSAIGVVYIGGVDRDGHPKDTRTPAQKDALQKLLRSLKAKYKGALIQSHRGFPTLNKAQMQKTR